MKKLLALHVMSAFLLWGLQLSAQNSTDYVFSYSTDTYTEIAGGTVLGTTSNDDQVFNNNTTGQSPPQTNTGFPIGFNFYYRGITYDKFAVNNNGWIVLGTGSFQIAAASGNYTPISTTGPAGFVNAISALGRDIQGQTGSELSYLTEGTAPNRCLVIQWKGYRKWNATGDNFNFQIRLYETTNKIVFCYGNFTVNATSSTPQVGIRGATNSDFHNRTTSTDWSTTSKGGSNSATCTLSSTVKPASGANYTFTPPSGPSGPPSFTATPFSSSQIDLAFTLDPNNDSVLILWSSTNSFTAPSGAPPAVGQPFAGGTVLYKGKSSPVNHTSLTPNTLYWYKAFSYAAGTYSSGVVQSATTLCVAVTTFPFSESFDGTTFAPACWLNQKTAGTSAGLWDRQTSGTNPTCSPHSGAGMARFNSFSYSNGTAGILVTPACDLPDDDYVVLFWMYRDEGYPTDPDKVNVYYNTAANLTGATLLGTINRLRTSSPVAPSIGWYQYSFELPAGSGGNNRYVIFEAVSDFGNNMFIDDVRITKPATLSGYVYDYYGDPVVSATVAKQGGGASDLSEADGSYTLFPLFEGSQNFIASKSGFIPDTVLLNIIEITQMTQDFTLLQPQIAVSPDTIREILSPTQQKDINLIISNNGTGPLDWNAATSESWITISNSSGHVDAFGGTESLSITLDAAATPSSKAPGGNYTGHVEFTSSTGASFDVVIIIVITDPSLAKPVNLHIDAINTSEGKLRLMWDYWADVAIDHFMIVRDGEFVANTPKNQYIDTVEDGEYCYMIYAVYNNGHLSDPSNEICLRFPPDPRIPLSNWALILASGLILGWAFVIFRRRI